MRFKFLAFFCLGTVGCFGSDFLKNMSLEEKVGQVLMVHFHGEEANEDARTLIQDTKIGSIIYYNWSNGLTSPAQVQALSAGLQQLARDNHHSIPLFIATDQEGGVVARLQAGFTSFPGNRALGETSDPNLAELSALAMGQELQAVGINMNLAPVVDVNSNPRNPVIGVRSFGDHPETVIAFGKKSLAGFKQAEVVATLKHFPGYGDVAVDPHEDLPVIRKSKAELEQVELLPFAKLASSADAIMTAHIFVPALDPENCSTLSEKTLNYLREVIGFQGVIVADSLVMDGVLKKCHSVDEASIAALNAGCDLLILGGKLLVGEHTGLELTTADVQRIHHSIVKAVKNGRVAEAKLNRAVERVLQLKKRYLNAKTPCVSASELREKVDTLEHRRLAQKIASLALQVKETHQIAHLSDQKIFLVAPEILQPTLQNTSLFNIGKSMDAYFFNSLNPSSAEIDAVKKQAEAADVVIVCSYNAWKNASAITLTQSLLQSTKPVIIFSVRDPLDASLFSDADLVVTSFGPTAPSLQAICDRLAEKSK
ncbi:MAG TPA: glycoside hydrolase family 3 protein [Chlamydiales bacterium]